MSKWTAGLYMSFFQLAQKLAPGHLAWFAPPNFPLIYLAWSGLVAMAHPKRNLRGHAGTLTPLQPLPGHYQGKWYLFHRRLFGH